MQVTYEAELSIHYVFFITGSVILQEDLRQMKLRRRVQVRSRHELRNRVACEACSACSNFDPECSQDAKTSTCLQVSCWNYVFFVKWRQCRIFFVSSSIRRVCFQPRLSRSARCVICGGISNQVEFAFLFECSLCRDVTHYGCFKVHLHFQLCLNCFYVV